MSLKLKLKLKLKNYLLNFAEIPAENNQKHKNNVDYP